MKAICELAVVGAGTAGMTAAITAAQRGLKVRVLDRCQVKPGNNSIVFLNAIDPFRQQSQQIQDSTELFYQQTLAYGENLAFPNLVKLLCYNSPGVLQWLEELGVHMPKRVIRIPEGIWPRTHSISYKRLTQALLDRASLLRLTISEQSEVCRILRLANGLWELHFRNGEQLICKNIVIASGQTSIKDLTEENEPCFLSHLLKIGAAVTGLSFINYGPADTKTAQFLVNPTQYILVNKHGKRFVAEDSTKRRLYEKIISAELPVFCLRFNSYVSTGVKLDSLFANQSAEFRSNVLSTLNEYRKSITAGRDYLSEGRSKNSLIPITDPGKIQTMKVEIKPISYLGGLAINSKSQVIGWDGLPIPGLYAAGGVCGGIHGKRAVRGNKLLASIVFGRIAGNSLPLS
ncbi:FAD-dependent oxidoreductase [Parasutterella muris]|uniref:FAD-dependent oxidoreductase n=1 Tax=Parasutterella muris TaxID=2565572 RepID=A0A6L6YJ33_9BURK|nr:FAD-dependent oxidoreductase [Parasutterella muris]MVX57647.1 FAD-dependent oxidoreductase [Parasutterella muris]